MDLSLAPTQAIRCQHFERDGLELGWKNRFYVKNDLKGRGDIKEVIMRPIWSRFGLRRPKIEIDETVETCQRAFSIVCSFIGTIDLIQGHIAFRVWPLIDSWKMPKETTTYSSEGGLI
jgi:hypothetical protein